MKRFYVFSVLALTACPPSATPDLLDDWTPGYPSADTGAVDTDTADTTPLGGLLAVEVNQIYDTRFGTSADPAVEPPPGSTLKAPGGNPTSSMISAMAKAVRGVSDAGFLNHERSEIHENMWMVSRF